MSKHTILCLVCMVLVAAILLWKYGSGLAGIGGAGKSENDLSGQCGPDLTYEYNAGTGKLTIRGHGPMTSSPWGGHKGVKVKSVEFEEGITALCKGAFYAQDKLAGDLVLPSTLTWIGDFAFYSTSSLQGIRLAPATTHLGDYAFRHSGISGELKLPETIRYLGEECFDGCKNLTGKLDLPKGLEKIGRCAFNGCAGFTGDLVIPDSVREIGAYAFAECKGLDGRLVISKGLREIPDSCFGGLKKIRGDLVIPDNVQVIGEAAFYGCGFDGQLVLPERMREIGSGAFQYCKELKGRVRLPQGLRRIEKRQFIGCASLGEIRLPDGIRYICNQAFNDCRALTKIELPDGLVGIGKYAFSGCKNLAGINLPKKLEILEDGAFANCKSLGGELKLPAGLLSIGERCFDGATSLQGRLLIPDSVAVLAASSFADCGGITEAVFGKGIESIGKAAFAGCGLLKSVTFNGQDFTPDYYRDAGKDSSFPAGCQIRMQTEKSIHDYYSDVNKDPAHAAPAGNGRQNDNAKGQAKECPYYWTDSLKRETFAGVGRYSDIRLTFDDRDLLFSVNGRKATPYQYRADANSSDKSIFLTPARIACKGVRIHDLKFVHGSRANFVQARLASPDGQKQTVYFTKNDLDVDPAIDARISLEEDLFRPD